METTVAVPSSEDRKIVVTTMDPRLAEILAQAARSGGTPAILLTRQKHPLWLVMPYAAENSEWLQEGRSRHTHRFVRDQQPPHWNVPKSWLSDLTRRLVGRFDACYIVQALRESEKCAAACWNAAGLECECACMGEHHGEGHPEGRWYEVSETCAVAWGPKQLHYKLIRAKPETLPTSP